jgi:hypothetical protein
LYNKEESLHKIQRSRDRGELQDRLDVLRHVKAVVLVIDRERISCQVLIICPSKGKEEKQYGQWPGGVKVDLSGSE